MERNIIHLQTQVEQGQNSQTQFSEKMQELESVILVIAVVL